MSTFYISKCFEVEADSFEEAWELADGDSTKLAMLSSGSTTIDVEISEDGEEN